MKAQVITQFGAPDVFTSADVATPFVTPQHVLIRVLGTSVNQIDCKIRSGAVAAIAPAFPAILHADVVGEIAAVGAGVTQFKVGDEVYGCAGGMKGTPGALAEFMLADADLIAKRPTALTLAETAALPLVSITAYEALFNKARLQKGQTILIHGGVGGVGHIAVQLAKAVGATVCATIIADKDIALAKSLGADEVINVKTESVEQYVQRLTQGKGFAVIFDAIGGPNLDTSFAAAAINGTIVTTAARSTLDLTPMHNKGLNLNVVFMLNPLLTGIGRKAHGKILQEIADLANKKQLKPLLDAKQFTISQVSAAHAHLESGQAKGKVVLLQD